MYIFWLVCAYTLIVLVMVLSHMFMTDYLNNYDKDVGKKMKYWHRVIQRCAASGNYRMKKKELRKFHNSRHLTAFFGLRCEKEKETGLLLDCNAQELIKVVRKNRYETEKAYFAYMLGKFPDSYDVLLMKYADFMLECLTRDSVYLRENALEVLYKIGEPQTIGEAFRILSEHGIYHNDKLLADGLMLYHKDEDVLIRYLMEQMERYSECYKVAIVKYMGYRNYHDCDDKLIPLLESSDSVDFKCCILRLLGKQKCALHRQILLQQIQLKEDESNWETAAVAARMLGEYIGDEEVEEALEKSIKARNWHVRRNSAEAISRIFVSDMQVADVLDGSDRYAAAALAYALDKKGENDGTDSD